MKVSIIVRTSEYRGDHSTDIILAHELKGDDETVKELVNRLLPKGSRDWIELRIIQDTN